VEKPAMQHPWKTNWNSGTGSPGQSADFWPGTLASRSADQSL
jgi:hypothetical protein